MEKLDTSEYNSFYQTYIDQVDLELGVIENLKKSWAEAENLLNHLDAKKYKYRYAPNKWSIQDLIQHLIDAERVFNYRALRIARNDAKGLEGFDQDNYVVISKADQRTFESLKLEFLALRTNTLHIYKSFDEKVIKRAGMVGGNNMSVRALGFVTSGHLLHHLNIIKNKYL